MKGYKYKERFYHVSSIKWVTNKGEGLVCLCTSSGCTIFPKYMESIDPQNVYAWRKRETDEWWQNKRQRKIQKTQKIPIHGKRNTKREQGNGELLKLLEKHCRPSVVSPTCWYHISSLKAYQSGSSKRDDVATIADKSSHSTLAGTCRHAYIALWRSIAFPNHRTWPQYVFIYLEILNCKTSRSTWLIRCMFDDSFLCINWTQNSCQI